MTTKKDPKHKQVGGSHYATMKIQPIEFIQANELGFVEGSVVKYVSRWKTKGGIQDLKKAIHLLELNVDYEEKKQSNERKSKSRNR